MSWKPPPDLPLQGVKKSEPEPTEAEALIARCKKRLAAAEGDVGLYAAHYREDVAALLAKFDPPT